MAGASRPDGASATAIVAAVAAVALVAVVAVAGVALLRGDDEPPSQAVRDTPAPTPSGRHTASPSPPGERGGPTPARSPGGDDTGAVALPDDAPGTVFAVSPPGLERVDPRTGERAVALAADDSQELVSYPANVDVWPDGGRAAIDVCCEPVPGSTYIADATGDAIDGLSLLRSGAIHPAVSPNGRRIALSAGSSGGSIVIVDRTGQRAHEIAGPSAAPGVGEMAWSRDGERLAFEWGAEDPGVWVIDADATDLADAREVAGRSGVVYESPTFRADGMLVVTESEPPAVRRPEEGGELTGTSSGVVLDPDSGEVRASFDYAGRVLSQDYDATGTYLVYSLADGSVRWQGGGRTGEIAPAGSPPLSALAW